MTPEQRRIVVLLLQIAHVTFHALDDSEDIGTPDDPYRHVIASADLCALLDEFEGHGRDDGENFHDVLFQFLAIFGIDRSELTTAAEKAYE